MSALRLRFRVRDAFEPVQSDSEAERARSFCPLALGDGFVVSTADCIASPSAMIGFEPPVVIVGTVGLTLVDDRRAVALRTSP